MIKPKKGKKAAESNDQAQRSSDVILLYDGVCVVCNWATRFIIDRDPLKRFHFASLQSDYAKQAIRNAGLLESELFVNGTPNQAVVLENGRVSCKSQAAGVALRELGGFWSWIGLFILLIPVVIRDTCYDTFASIRYSMFGKTDIVEPIPAGEEDRFLDIHEGIHSCPFPSTLF